MANANKRQPNDTGTKQPSGIVGWFGIITATVVGIGTFLTALDALISHVPVTCKFWSEFPWCGTHSIVSKSTVSNSSIDQIESHPDRKTIKPQCDLPLGAPPMSYIENPVLAPMQEKKTTGDGSLIGVHEVGIYGCVIDGSSINCYLTERNMASLRHYNIDNQFGQETRLTDNYHISHNKIRAAWFDGRGCQHSDLDQGPDDSAWIVLVFDGADTGISKVRIAFRAFGGGYINGQIRTN